MKEPERKVVGKHRLNNRNMKNCIERSYVCDAYEEDTERLFASRECWYCKFADFGINTGNPTQLGVCLYKTKEI